ncbi:MAG: hypothetical protein JNM88_14655 [Chitinophagaceae bacterium]|nr:hypothetical protein [Chitinophagaceae bacterium]
MKKFRFIPGVLLLLVFSFPLAAQVPVYEEPVHKPVFVNKYFRLMDVHIKAGDTTLFHIHSTPSAFVYHTSTSLATQIKGQGWVKEKSEAGKAWFRSFRPDSLVHRVAVVDSMPLHVNDVEILSAYQPAAFSLTMPYAILFENDTAVGYRLTNADLTGQEISGRGPLLAILVKGEGVEYHDVPSDERRTLLPGRFLYISPGLVFTLNAKGTYPADLVIFEIK